MLHHTSTVYNFLLSLFLFSAGNDTCESILQEMTLVYPNCRKWHLCIQIEGNHIFVNPNCRKSHLYAQTAGNHTCVYKLQEITLCVQTAGNHTCVSKLQEITPVCPNCRKSHLCPNCRKSHMCVQTAENHFVQTVGNHTCVSKSLSRPATQFSFFFTTPPQSATEDELGSPLSHAFPQTWCISWRRTWCSLTSTHAQTVPCKVKRWNSLLHDGP